MRCPFCNHEESKVTDSRNSDQVIRRRRQCLSCNKRFTTFESVELTVQVRKRDGNYEDFSQEKLIRGLEAACRHTRISRHQALEIASKITAQLTERQTREIDALDLGEIVMRHLQALDKVAYIRFACVYRRFKDVDELKDAIENVSPHDDKEKAYASEICSNQAL